MLELTAHRRMDENKATGIPVFIAVYIIAVVVWVPCLLLSLGAPHTTASPSFHICTRTGLTSATSDPRLCSEFGFAV